MEADKFSATTKICVIANEYDKGEDRKLKQPKQEEHEEGTIYMND